MSKLFLDVALAYLAIGLVLYRIFNDPNRLEQRLARLGVHFPLYLEIGHIVAFVVFVLCWPYIVLPGLTQYMIGVFVYDRPQSQTARQRIQSGRYPSSRQ